MTSPAAILDMIRRGRTPLPRIAVVTAVDDGPPLVVTVRFVEGGDEFQPVVATQSSVPDVGDHCLVVPTVTQWVYLSAVSDPSADVEYHAVDVLVERNWLKTNAQGQTPWHWVQDRGANAWIDQGRWGPQQGGIGDPVPTSPPMTDYASILVHNVEAVLDAIAAASGTVHLVELVMTRTDPASPVQASPIMYGHQYTAEDPPTAGQPPTWTPGFGPLRLPGFSEGQTARWILPSSWTTALAAGSITGIAFYSDTTRDRFRSAPDGSALSRNARLAVTYSAPEEIFP